MIRAILMATGTQLSATTKTRLNGNTTVTMPSWARQIESVIPYSVVDALDDDECNSGIITLESDDVAIVPYEIPYNPAAGPGGTSGSGYMGEIKAFPLHCPLKGGEEISAYGTADLDNTSEPYTALGFVVTDQITGRQVFSKMGTATATGTSAAEVAGTAYNIHGSQEIIYVLGYVAYTTATQVEDNAIVGYFRLTSNDFKVSVPLKYPFNVIPGTMTAVDSPIVQPPVRWAVNVPTNTTCTISDYCNFDVAPTAAGIFRSGVMFNKVGR